MARWRLTQKHYLKVEGTEWEYKETTNSGRAIKKVFPVPMFLDPDYPFDCNYPREAREQDRNEIIVAHKAGALPHDYIFEGPPTPDMIPLDDGAKTISAGFALQWGSPPAESGDEGYTGKLLSQLTETLQSFNASAKPSGAVSESSIIAEMQAQMKQLIEMNMALMGKIEAPLARRA